MVMSETSPERHIRAKKSFISSSAANWGDDILFMIFLHCKVTGLHLTHTYPDGSITHSGGLERRQRGGIGETVSLRRADVDKHGAGKQTNSEKPQYRPGDKERQPQESYLRVKFRENQSAQYRERCHGQKGSTHQPGLYRRIAYDKSAYDAYCTAYGLWQTYPGFTDSFIHQKHQQRLCDYGKRRFTFRLHQKHKQGTVKEFRVIHHYSHIERRQKHRNDESNILYPPQENSVYGLESVVVEGLETLTEQLRHYHGKWYTVYQKCCTSLDKPGAENVRTFGSAGGVEQPESGFFKERSDVACGEDSFQLHIIKGGLYIADKLFRHTVFHVAKAYVRPAFLALGHQFHNKLWTFQPPPEQGHITADCLHKSLMTAHKTPLAGGFANAACGISLHAESQPQGRAVRKKHHKTGVHKPEQGIKVTDFRAVGGKQHTIADMAHKSGCVRLGRYAGKWREDQFRCGLGGDHSLTAYQQTVSSAAYKPVKEQVKTFSGDFFQPGDVLLQ